MACLKHVLHRCGNRTQLIDGGVVTPYAYAQDSNRLTSVGLQSYSYDAAGNTLSDGEHAYQYDARNRMTAVGDNQYGYNALGQRAFKPRFQTSVPGDADGDGIIDERDLLVVRDIIQGKAPATPGADCNGDGAVDNKDLNCIARQVGAQKRQGDGRTRETEATASSQPASTAAGSTQAGWLLFQYDDAGRLIGEYDESGNAVRQYVWLDDLPLAMLTAGGIYYLHADHLNTPRVATDGAGQIVWSANLRPFGDEFAPNASTLEMPLRFPGRYFDRETGLHQNWHREYAPELGRYTQSDPIGVLGGPNIFVFALLNPITTTDLDGLSPHTESWYNSVYPPTMRCTCVENCLRSRDSVGICQLL